MASHLASHHGSARQHQPPRQQEVCFKFAHSTESPFDTSLRQHPVEDEVDTSIYTAKQIADFVLSVPLEPNEKEQAIKVANMSGIDLTPLGDVQNCEEIFSFNCILAIAHFYNKRRQLAENEDLISATYRRCVCALNSLTYFLQKPKDRTALLPGPVRLDSGERWKLDRTWDICVCILGATKAWFAFDRHSLIGDAPIVHDEHYRKFVKLGRDNLQKCGRICPKAFHLLTREEVEPFVHPCHLVEELNKIDCQLEHRRCKDNFCIYDIDATQVMSPDNEYHVFGCSSCARLEPPRGSEHRFNEIAKTGMPAVNIYCDQVHPESWYVPADEDVLVVSHVWRDGIWGTRDQGIQTCVHQLLVRIAERQDCKCYWMDCAVIPEDAQVRRSLIAKINPTFSRAKMVLCWDKQLAHTEMDREKTLLSILISIWHRRAWTLLEGNRAPSQKIGFLKMKQDAETGNWSFNIFKLKSEIHRVFDDLSPVPFWIRSALVDLLPYSGIDLSVGAAGLSLSGRQASRPGDSENIWGLIRPFIPRRNESDLPFNDPYAFSNGKVDVAFISSNAARAIPRRGAFSWKPGSTATNVWVRTAYGGIRCDINERGSLAGSWWARKEDELKKQIRRNRESSQLLNTDFEKLSGFALICPILQGDIRTALPETVGRELTRGFFRTRISMECSRAIAVTQDRENDVWQWRGLVHLTRPVSFKVSNAEYFEIGG